MGGYIKRLADKIVHLKNKIQNTDSAIQRAALFLILFVLSILHQLVGGMYYIFFPSTASFQYLNSLEHKEGYTSSYVRHQKAKRTLRFSTVGLFVGILAVTGTFTDYIAKLTPTRAAACNISGSVTIDSAYITTNSCDDITVTGDGIITFTEAIDLGGEGDYTFTVAAGVEATFQGALELSDTGDVVVIDGVVTHAPQQVAGVDITAGAVTISGTGSINVAGKGCKGGEATSEDGYGPNTGSGGTCTVNTTGGGDGNGSYGTGGSYGGVGGFSGVQPVGSAYGSSLTPTFLGSGGGAGDVNDGGDGGGLISINAITSLHIEGTIVADGGPGLPLTNFSATVGAGGGSGGAVYISTAALSGSGAITADGGDGGQRASCCGNDGSGGAGGKIAVYYSSSSFDSSSITALGGAPGLDPIGASAGDNGTAFMLNTSTDSMAILTGFSFVDGEDYTRAGLTIADGAQLTCQDASTLAISSEGTIDFTNVDWRCNELGALTIAADTITTSGTNVMSFAAAGATVDWSVNNDLTLSGLTYNGGTAGTTSGTGGVWTIDNPIDISLVSSTIYSSVQWTNLTGLDIGAASSIVADTRGCSGGTQNAENGYGPAIDTNICTISTSGFGDGDVSGASGAGHGGAGGISGSQKPGATYDSTTAPVLFGSGGGATDSPDWPGGNGGGVIRLAVAGNAIINGTLSAKGGNGQGSTRGSGGGSGGSIYVSTIGLDGTGSMAAGGGTGGDRTSCCGSDGGGGGGGIVSVWYVTNKAFDLVSDLTAAFGPAGAAPLNATNGSNGVTHTRQLTQPDQPSIVTPLNSSYNNDVNTVLTASTFSDTGAGHSTTDWKVTTDVDGVDVVWSSTDNGANLESITVNDTDGAFSGDLAEQTELASNTPYYAFVQYTNPAGDSLWSLPMPFTTTYTGASSSQVWNFDDAAEYLLNEAYVDIVASLSTLVDLGSGSYAFLGMPGWTKSKTLTVTNVTTELTDFQVKVNVTYDADMQPDFDDIRFTQSDGITEIPYYREKYVSSTSAIFWIKVPTLPQNSTTDIIMYYGNDSVATTSNGDETFIYYNGFETPSGWTNIGSGTVTQSSDRAYQGTYSAKKGTANETSGAYAVLDQAVGRNVIAEAFVYRPSPYAGVNADRWALENDASDGQGNGYGFNYTHSGLGTVYVDKRTNGVGSTQASSPTASLIDNQWYLAHLELNGSQIITRLYDTDYVQKASAVYANTDTTSFTTWTIKGGYNVYYDEIRIRKQIAVPPNVSIGSEVDLRVYNDFFVAPSSSGVHPVVDTIFGISHTLGGSNAGSVVYQIGVDSDDDDTVNTWYYHDGSSWIAVSDDITDHNTIEQVNAYIPALISDVGMSSDQVFFKAFLLSNGTQMVELDSVTLQYNLLPLFNGTIGDQNFTEDQSGTDNIFDLDDYFSDSSDETLTYSATDDLDPALGTMTIGGDGTVDLTLESHASGADTIAFRATDQTGATVDSNALTVTVTPVNDAPVLEAIGNKSVAENGTLSASVNATDVESDALTLSVTEVGTAFTDAGIAVNDLFTDNGDGTGDFSWTPTFEQAGSYQLTVTATDGSDEDTETITIIVGNTDTAPSFNGTIANVALQAGETAVNAFDLDTYFTDAEGDLAYAVSGDNDVTVTINDDGTVTIAAPNSFSGSNELVFSATDIDGNIVESDSLVVTVTNSDIPYEETPDEDAPDQKILDDNSSLDFNQIGAVQGTLSGPGVVEVRDMDGEVLSTWTAFAQGGAVPRVAWASGEMYVFVTKANSGSSIKAYTIDGQYIGKKNLKLHWRRVTAGNLNKNKRNDEVVTAIRKNQRVKLKVFTFHPNKKKVFQLKKRITFRGLKSKNFSVQISGRKVLVKDEQGNTQYSWKPFAKK